MDRTAEKVLIRSVLDVEGTGKRILVHGQGGVGKSALALSVAYEELQRPTYEFVAWVDCDRIKFSRGRFTQAIAAPADINDIARELALVVKSEAALHATGREALRALRTRLSELRGLIIVDALDALNSAEVEEFLLGLPHTIDLLVTCRANLKWPASVMVRPWPPRSQDARSFLEQQACQQQHVLTEPEISAILDAGRGIPLVISWCMVLVDRGVSVERLTDLAANGWLNLLDYAFELQWQRDFRPGAQREFAALVALSGGISSETLAEFEAFCGSDNGAPAARTLLDANFATLVDGRIEAVPFARDFILKKLEEETQLLRRVTTRWLISLVQRVRSAIAAPTWKAAFDKIDGFRDELSLALEWSSRLWRTPPNVFLDLTEATAYYFYSRGLWDKFLRWEALGVRTALQRRRVRYVVEVALVWGVRIQLYRNGRDAATSYLQQVDANVAPLTANHPVLETIRTVAESSLREITPVSTALADALERQAQDLLNEREDEWACRAMLHAGNAWSELGELTRADAAFDWSRLHARARSGPTAPWMTEMVALSIGNQGILANRAGRYRDAVQLLRESIGGLAQTYDLATAHGEYALALTESGDQNSRALCS